MKILHLDKNHDSLINELKSSGYINVEAYKMTLDNVKSIIHQFELKLKKPINAKYVRIKAKNFGKCPSWHPGNGGTSWLFFDEITII